MKLVDLVLNACAYRYPENIELPAGYTPPGLAIAAHYWKAWIILLILAAHNPLMLGALAWTKYPTLRTLMEMCITGHFTYTPGFDDLQNLTIEKQRILEFESHLAAASTKVYLKFNYFEVFSIAYLYIDTKFIEELQFNNRNAGFSSSI